MGLLDSVIGALSGGQQAQGAQGGAGGGLGGLIGMVTSNPQLLQAVTGMLGNDGEHGGLGGLVSKFEQAGLGNVVGSWIGNGQNQPVTGDQLTQVLGSGAISNIAAKLGVSPDEAAGQLSNILPGLVNHLTPNGQAPAGGLGNTGDLMGMLGGLLHKS
ncbi:MAG: YidB family protein [Rhodoferax sp.]|nr:YidB family protein [Rhodoferax sp.]